MTLQFDVERTNASQRSLPYQESDGETNAVPDEAIMLGERFSMPYVIGLAIRVRESDVVTEPLPERWVDLIRYLDEKERSSQRLSNRMLSTSFTHGEQTEECIPHPSAIT